MICIYRRKWRISPGLAASRSRPAKRTLPELGSMSRNTRRPNVLFPDPDSPTRPRVSPAWMSSVTSSTARTSPLARAPNIDSPRGKTFVRLRISTRGKCLHVHRGRLAGDQLAQHKLQDAAVGVVLRLLRRVDAHQRVELFGLACARGANSHLFAGRELPDQVDDGRNLKDFISPEVQRLRTFSCHALQRQNSHI